MDTDDAGPPISYQVRFQRKDFGGSSVPFLDTMDANEVENSLLFSVPATKPLTAAELGERARSVFYSTAFSTSDFSLLRGAKCAVVSQVRYGQKIDQRRSDPPVCFTGEVAAFSASSGTWTLTYNEGQSRELVQDPEILKERLGLTVVLDKMRNQDSMFPCAHCGIHFQTKFHLVNHHARKVCHSCLHLHYRIIPLFVTLFSQTCSKLFEGKEFIGRQTAVQIDGWYVPLSLCLSLPCVCVWLCICLRVFLKNSIMVLL